MKTLTVKEVLYDEVVPEDPDYGRMYRLRAGNYILYIGITNDHICNRLNSHMGWGYCNSYYPSPMGRMIIENAPRSNEWLFDFYTDENIAALWKDLFSTYRQDLPAWDIVARVESKLISIYNPHCNSAHRSGKATPLPDGIKDI